MMAGASGSREPYLQRRTHRERHIVTLALIFIHKALIQN